MKTLKKAISVEKQIAELEKKGIIINNEDYASRVLNRINYYRLLGYLLPFKNNDGTYEKVSFKRICKVLAFDQLLRNLILKYIEHVEISLRTFIVKSMAFLDDGDGMSYLNPDHYRNEKSFCKWLDTINDAVEASDEPFIIHYKKEYGGKYPCWVILEVLSIGKISRMYELLRSPLRREIASCYKANIPPTRLISYLKAISYLRNKCAHHSRIYYRTFIKNAMKKEWYDKKKIGFSNKKFMSQLCILKDLCVDNNTWGSFLQDLSKLIENFKDYIELEHIGFPEDWKDIIA